MKKIIIGIVCILLFVISGIGCIEVHIEPEYVEPNEVIPHSEYVPTYSGYLSDMQRINGNDKIMSVSGDQIHINGIGNEITILNSDVSLIRVNGRDNIIYYPSDAKPQIMENGIDNVIRVY